MLWLACAQAPIRSLKNFDQMPPNRSTGGHCLVATPTLRPREAPPVIRTFPTSTVLPPALTRSYAIVASTLVHDDLDFTRKTSQVRCGDVQIDLSHDPG